MMVMIADWLFGIALGTFQWFLPAYLIWRGKSNLRGAIAVGWLGSLLLAIVQLFIGDWLLSASYPDPMERSRHDTPILVPILFVGWFWPFVTGLVASWFPKLT